MFVVKHASDLLKLTENKHPIGFVPTMGALHQGHISLIKRSVSKSRLTICSIFVNPTQFNDPQDYLKYPKTLEQDILMLEQAGCDVLFLPEVNEMYPEGIHQIRQYDIGFLNTVLEGLHRPGHFNGVCAIVHKLLDSVQPDILFLGEKDFQQCLVIQQLIKLEALPVSVEICETTRHISGLAMSSRNQRLSESGRELASSIYKNLQDIRAQWRAHSFSVLREKVIDSLSKASFETEYLELADASNLEPLQEFDAGSSMVVLIATRLEGIRLIDNIRIQA